MLASARRRPVRWIAALALTATAGFTPVLSVTTADAASTDACGVKLAKASGGTWTCSFVDNFSGTALDTKKWTVMDTATYGFYLGDTCFIKGQGLKLSQGQLKMTTVRKAPFTCKTPGGSFQTQNLGAGLATAGKFSQAYGRFEARMKLPAYTGPGLHGGYWLNPQEMAYGAWPASGEIDVAEWFSAWADNMYPSLHYSGSSLQKDTAFNCAAGRVGAFHTYSVEWVSTKMDFIYDGKLCFSRTWEPTVQIAPQPFDKAFYNTLTWGAAGGVDPATDTTDFPATLTVDYVKSWY
ncbi:glycoside hydrolase family 16 protein [Nocardioides cavernaquae]|nr:glycoside hydrolase family 16 protein [Nocardioides cavernaquae]